MIFPPTYMTKKKTENEEPEEEKQELYYAQKKDEMPRIVGICGDLDEEKAGELMYGMIALYESGITYKLSDPTDENSEILASYSPFEFLISTLGGNAQEMFGVHDLMRAVRENCDIHTVGLGKVFSAGTLLLASGTKGKRRIVPCDIPSCEVVRCTVPRASVRSIRQCWTAWSSAPRQS